jgi:hypothetical protein
MDTQKIFDYFKDQHDLLLLDSEVNDIIHLIIPQEYPRKIEEEPMSKEAIDFGEYLVGHDRETIKQMYQKWKRFL